MGIVRFEDLRVWKVAHEAVLETYRLTRSYPMDERFGLVKQMRRAAVSMPANIAEGFGRRSSRDKVRFYNMSQASLEELRYYLRLSRDLGYATDVTTLSEKLDETARMLKGLVLKTLSFIRDS